jgi:PKD repeat protein
MIRILLLIFALCILPPPSSTAQISREPGKHLPKATPVGINKINTRIDNMRYWRKMVDSGYVYPAAVASVPAAVYTGSRIKSPMVVTADSPDVPTTEENSTQSEASVFVHPENNMFVLNSNNSTQNPVGELYGTDYLLSNDGGETWGGSITGAGGSNSGDPAAAIGLSGREYIGFIDDDDGQSVAYSDDEGETWIPVVAATQNGNLLDKNHMWVDNSESSPYEGNIYVAYTDFGVSGCPIEMTRSTNEGSCYSTPLNISAAANAGSHNQGVNIQTGPDGEVYAAWAIYDSWPSDESAIGFAKSIDGGVNYTTAARIMSNIRGIRTTETSKNHRVNSFPSMAVDISGGPYNGYIYLVWSNIGTPGINTGSDIDVYMIRSTNEGVTWSAPVKVNQDEPGLGKEHYFPWIACDRITGEVSVIFYDDRNVSSSQVEVFVASSADGGITWEDFKVSDVAFTPSPIPGLAGGYMGDYIGITALGSRVYPAWPDNRSGTVITYTSPFNLSPVTTARFAAANTLPCLGNPVQFTDLSTRNPDAWHWTVTPASCSFLSGTNAFSQNPVIKFNAYGNYTIQLIAENEFGADTLVKTGFISVNVANADFVAGNITPAINNPVVFTNMSSCNVSSYSWNFGACATPATASGIGPHTVSYSSTGFKTVSLTVNGNVTETKTNYIEVLPLMYNMSNGTIIASSGLFFDPQGNTNYLDNQNLTMTIRPADTSKSIQLIFSLFDLEASTGCTYDWLKIYDGLTTCDSLLGTWCGTDSPDTVTAYKSSGALTCKFHSDIGINDAGWIAGISCVTTPVLPLPPPPVYCVASTANWYKYINNVQINTISNPTAGTCGGYANYTSIQTTVVPGLTYPITVSSGNLRWPADRCGIWIDWNRDSDFNDANETITVSGSPGIGPYTANVLVPANALKGLTRMRIRIMYGTPLNPCGSTTYGEVEDYGVYVSTPGLWKGGIAGSETDCNTPGNWDDGMVPCSNTDVTIPDNSFYDPEASGSFTCQDIEIKDGATLTVEQGAVMNVNGNLSVGQGNSGVLIIDGGTCNVAGSIKLLPGSAVNIINNGAIIDH